MQPEDLITGIQHIGIPTDDIEKTVAFYNGLGFETVLRTTNRSPDDPVAFLKLKNIVIETYLKHGESGSVGAINHVAIDVTDIDAAFRLIKGQGRSLCDAQIQSLPFWEHGIRYFSISGPNNEIIEFNQIL